ncbi:potassium transporter TrkG [Pseudomonas sp. SP16.1]|uniref:potassium transporter TrkG n=1 Tax=Pseudomonas sp. SP16.1 TaxID=3458854 RepID=UPI0040465198
MNSCQHAPRLSPHPACPPTRTCQPPSHESLPASQPHRGSAVSRGDRRRHAAADAAARQRRRAVRGHGLPWAEAAWSGLFHAVSAFNNAGFSIHADSLVGYAGDGLILTPVMAAIVIGGIGFPVLQDLRNRLRDPRHWSLHTKLTLSGTALLLLGGFLALLLAEWANPRTLGAMPLGDKLLSAAFASVSARTAGFNSIDIGALPHESWAIHYFLMFVGGGSAGTAGGVKITTAAVLLLLVVAEIRGRSDTEAFGRRVSDSAQRQAITVLVLGSAMVVLGTLVILRNTEIPTDQVIFEVISAFGTVGLSTGITASLPESSQ